MRAPSKSPTMGGPQRCRHGETAHLCQWCSYQNGKADGRKVERLRCAALARSRAEEHRVERDWYADGTGRAGEERPGWYAHDAARDALLALAKEVEESDGA